MYFDFNDKNQIYFNLINSAHRFFLMFVCVLTTSTYRTISFVIFANFTETDVVGRAHLAAVAAGDDDHNDYKKP